MNHKLAIGVLACMSLALASAAHAQAMTAAAASPAGASGKSQSCGEATGPTSCGAGGPASKNNKTVDEGGGNPINVITGNKYQREVDLPALPGVLGLELVRHYNSQFSGIGFPNGIMGRGWKLSYETELHVVGRALQVVQADGARLIFSRDLLDPSHCGTSRASDGRIVIRRGPRGDEYVWTWPDGRRLSFDHRGKLVQIAVPTGEFVTVQHDARGHLVQVTDPQGRQLKLNYAEPARGKGQPVRFTGVQSIDTPVGRYVYEYGSTPPKGTQVEKIQLVANLVKVHLPTHYDADKPAHTMTSRGTTTSSVNRSYHYEDARFPTLLTGISVSGSGSDGKPLNQRISTYGYDQRAWAVSSEHGGLKVELATLERASLSELPGSTPGRSVLVHGRTATRPEGHRLEIRSAMVAGDYRITETRGVACPEALPCPRANMRYGYDTKGRLTEEIQLDPNGRPRQMVRTGYDPMDRVLRISQFTYKGGKAGAERWVVRYEYGASGEQPMLIAKPSVVPGHEHQMRLSYNEQGQLVQLTETAWRPAFLGQAAEPITRKTQHVYQQLNGRSVLASTDGPLPGSADTTRYQWDARGDFVQALNHPLGLTETYRRDNTGRVIVQTPPDRVDIALEHLPTGERSSWQRGAAVAKVWYDALQRPTRIELPDGEVRRLAYANQEGTAIASNSGWARWLALPASLDSQSFASELPTALREPPSLPHDQTQDEASRNQSWQGAQAVVDDFGRLLAMYSAATGWETRHYDQAGQLLERRLADGTAWRWQRDVLGRIVQHETAVPGKNPVVTRLQYKGTLLVALQHPLESEQLGHDPWGRLAWRTVTRMQSSDKAGSAPAQLWRYTERYDHDSADRMTAIHLPEGDSLHYTWGIGQQLQRVTWQRAWAVSKLADWFGWGRRTLIEPLPPDREHPASVAAGRSSVVAPAGAVVMGLSVMGPSSGGYRFGNGIELRWERNQDGRLARMDYLPSSAPSRSWTQRWVTWLPSAHAVAAPAQPLLRMNYQYDPFGRMSERQLQGATQPRIISRQAYDNLGRLLVVERTSRSPEKGDEKSTTRAAISPEYYAYDRSGQTLATHVNGQDRRWIDKSVERDGTGLPKRVGEGDEALDLVYSADRRLSEVSRGGKLIAVYGHNTHGQRIEKRVRGGHQDSAQGSGDTSIVSYLWQTGRLSAETLPRRPPTSDGEQTPRLARRYVHANNLIVAVIDHTGGVPMDMQDGNSWLNWARAVWQAVTSEKQLHYLHANELGTPIAASNAHGQLVWRTAYSAYGLPLEEIQRPDVAQRLEINLRMPGQYFDAETGWYDNGRRTYDPQRGQYLEPDPLGPLPNWRSGQLLTQSYAYANHNPLIYADPTGLILFAFDGTGNSNPAQPGSSLSNVHKFFSAYDSEVNGERFYITGIGTTNVDMPVRGSEATGSGFRERLNLATRFLEDFIRKDKNNDNQWLDIDIVGFSRGAAEARAWVSEIENLLNSSRMFITPVMGGQRRCINFRFLGLWDTVPHIGAMHGNERFYDFNIPASVGLAAHAVALNEHRGSIGDFDAESIHANANTRNSSTRIERGFIGAHSDIGGGYGEGDLSDVALMWMIAQATSQGISFNNEQIVENDWDIVTNPIIHDSRVGNSSRERLWPDEGDRNFNYRNGTRVDQRNAQLHAGANNTTQTQEAIAYFRNPCGPDGTIVGMVDMKRYERWLNSVPITYETSAESPPECSVKK